MNPFAATISATRLDSQRNSTSDFLSAAYAILSLCSQLNPGGDFNGSDYLSEVTRRLKEDYGLPAHFVSKLDREIFQPVRSKRERGLI